MDSERDRERESERVDSCCKNMTTEVRSKNGSSIRSVNAIPAGTTCIVYNVDREWKERKSHGCLSRADTHRFDCVRLNDIPAGDASRRRRWRRRFRRFAVILPPERAEAFSARRFAYVCRRAKFDVLYRYSEREFAWIINSIARA